MVRWYRGWWRLAGNLMLAIALVCGASAASYAETLKVGMVLGLSGVAALIGKSGQTGAEVAIDEVNARGGVMGQHKLELLVRDDKLRPEIGARELEELILKEKIQFALGPVSSSVGLAVSEVARKYKVPIITHTSNTERQTVERGHRYMFQVVPNTFMEGTLAAIRAAEQPWKRYYLIGPDYEYGHSVIDAFKRKIKQLHPDIEILGEFWPKLGETDFTSYITAMQAAKPDVMYTTLWGADQIAFVKQARSRNFFDAIPMMWLSELDTLRALGNEMVLGMLCHTRAPFYAIDTPEMARFVAQYKTRTGEYPSDCAILAYDAMSIRVQAMEQAKTTDREKVVEALEQGTFQSLRGPIAFRKEDHMGNVPYYAGVIGKSDKYPFYILTDVKAIPGDKLWRPAEEIPAIRAAAEKK